MPDLSHNKCYILHSLYAAYYGFYDILIPTDDAKSTFRKSLHWVIPQRCTDIDPNAGITGALIGAALGWQVLIEDMETLRNIQILLNSDSNQGDFPRQSEYTLHDVEFVLKRLHTWVNPNVC
jgi:hypothetical protein